MNDDQLKYFVRKYNVAIPKETLETETLAMTASELQRRKYETMRTGDMFSYMRTDILQLTEEMKEAALRELQLESLAKAVIKEENITVTEEEVQAEARRIAGRQNVTLDMLKGFFGENLSAIRRDLLENKALAFLERKQEPEIL
ncbi:MAG: hypothetical protein ACOYBE_10485 [Blautia sp.]|jgi:trigger factor